MSVGGECKAVSTDITGLDDSRKHHAGYREGRGRG